jgi:hypothetical protein
MAFRMPKPGEKFRIGRAPTAVPVFSTCTTPELEPAPGWGDQVLVLTHPYRFAPAAATVRKYKSPVLHVAGNWPPVFAGLVSNADPKSTFLDWTRRSTWVCAATGTTHAKMNHALDRIMVFDTLLVELRSPLAAGHGSLRKQWHRVLRSSRGCNLQPTDNSTVFSFERKLDRCPQNLCVTKRTVSPGLVRYDG